MNQSFLGVEMPLETTTFGGTALTVLFCVAGYYGIGLAVFNVWSWTFPKDSYLDSVECAWSESSMIIVWNPFYAGYLIWYVLFTVLPRDVAHKPKDTSPK